MTLFRQKALKTGKTTDALVEILKIHDEQEIRDIRTKCTTVLHALPVYLREEVSGFFRSCKDKSDEPELDGVAVALLTVISDHDTSPVHYQPVRVSVIENDTVVSLPRFGYAFLVLFLVMDEFVQNKLTEWGLSEFIDKFRDEAIDEEALYLLRDQDIIALFPTVGPRVIFREKLHLLKNQQSTTTPDTVDPSAKISGWEMSRKRYNTHAIVSPHGKCVKKTGNRYNTNEGASTSSVSVLTDLSHLYDVVPRGTPTKIVKIQMTETQNGTLIEIAGSTLVLTYPGMTIEEIASKASYNIGFPVLLVDNIGNPIPDHARFMWTAATGVMYAIRRRCPPGPVSSERSRLVTAEDSTATLEVDVLQRSERAGPDALSQLICMVSDQEQGHTVMSCTDEQAQAIRDGLSCPICTEMLKEPMFSTCCNRFVCCNTCFAQMDFTRCPLCRAEADASSCACSKGFNPKRVLALEEVLAELRNLLPARSCDVQSSNLEEEGAYPDAISELIRAASDQAPGQTIICCTDQQFEVIRRGLNCCICTDMFKNPVFSICCNRFVCCRDCLGQIDRPGCTLCGAVVNSDSCGLCAASRTMVHGGVALGLEEVLEALRHLFPDV